MSFITRHSPLSPRITLRNSLPSRRRAPLLCPERRLKWGDALEPQAAGPASLPPPLPLPGPPAVGLAVFLSAVTSATFLAGAARRPRSGPARATRFSTGRQTPALRAPPSLALRAPTGARLRPDCSRPLSRGDASRRVLPQTRGDVAILDGTGRASPFRLRAGVRSVTRGRSWLRDAAEKAPAGGRRRHPLQARRPLWSGTLQDTPNSLLFHGSM